jgi:hypothetical protein
MQNTKHNKIQPSKGAKTEPQTETYTSTVTEEENAQLIQSIRARCLELIQDAKGIVPGLRIVGVFSLHDAIAEQTATSLLCYDTLAIKSQKLSQEAERRTTCACDGEDFMCEDCRAEMEETLKKQNEELASEKDEILG